MQNEKLQYSIECLESMNNKSIFNGFFSLGIFLYYFLPFVSKRFKSESMKNLNVLCTVNVRSC